jgi:hypothetical protein
VKATQVISASVLAAALVAGSALVAAPATAAAPPVTLDVSAVPAAVSADNDGYIHLPVTILGGAPDGDYFLTATITDGTADGGYIDNDFDYDDPSRNVPGVPQTFSAYFGGDSVPGPQTIVFTLVDTENYDPATYRSIETTYTVVTDVTVHPSLYLSTFDDRKASKTIVGGSGTNFIGKKVTVFASKGAKGKAAKQFVKIGKTKVKSATGKYDDGTKYTYGKYTVKSSKVHPGYKVRVTYKGGDGFTKATITAKVNQKYGYE